MPVSTMARRRKPRLSPLAAHLIWSIGLAAAVSIVLALWLHVRWIWCWLIAINLATFVAYAYDKFAARRTPQWRRVPEKALHALAAIGGTPAALLGQRLLRHKTIKSSFRFWFWAILIVQIAVIVIGLTR